MERRDDSWRTREYQTLMGRPHRNMPDDHPDLWQWRYTGSPAERDELLERLATVRRERQPEPVQESLL